jgi:hypothetical protein
LCIAAFTEGVYGMKAQRSSLYIKTEGVNEQAIAKGLAWLVALGNNDVNKRSALLAVPLKANLQDAISSVMRETNVKRLGKGEKVTISNSNVQISLLTERKTIYSWDGPILVIYPTKRLLDKIDGLTEVTDVLVIPWTLEEVQFWVDTWSAIELGANPQAKTAKPFSNPIVEAALENLTRRVNLSTGITHPRDRSLTIELFKILRDNEISYNPDEVRAWLVLHGWNPEDADNVKQVAIDVLARKRLRSDGQSRWRKDILEIWKEGAKKKQSGDI